MNLARINERVRGVVVGVPESPSSEDDYTEYENRTSK